MPRGIPLTEGEIRRRLQDLRNKTALHAAARQRVVLLEGENAQLRKTVADLAEENEALRAEAERLKDALTKERDANAKLRAMLFRKHRTRTRRLHPRVERSRESYVRPAPANVTERRELVLAQCPDCGTPVAAPVASRTRIIEDIVFQPQAMVTAWAIHRHWCASCGKLVSGTVPGVLPKTRIGPNTLTYVVLAKYRSNLPYAKIRDQLETCFGLILSEGEIAHLIATAARLVGTRWHEIVQAVKAGQTVHCDETGWSIDGAKVWAHTFATDHAVLYEIMPHRGKAVAEAMLDGFTGTRVTDCLPNYRNLSGTHQICWAHLTREAAENAERQPDNRERVLLSEELAVVYQDLRDATERAPWDEQRVDRIRRRCRKRLDRLRSTEWRDPCCRRLLRRLTDFDRALFTCLTEPGIPPDNNHAERCLRKLVVQRKISGGNRSPTHAVHHARLMSVVETLRLEGGNLLTGLQAVLHRGIVAELSRG